MKGDRLVPRPSVPQKEGLTKETMGGNQGKCGGGGRGREGKGGKGEMNTRQECMH